MLQVCLYCGGGLGLRKQRFCKIECRRAFYREKSMEECKNAIPEAPVSVRKERPKSKITDEQQYALNRKIDAKYYASLQYKHYKKGTKEFRQAAEDIMRRRRENENKQL